MSYFGQSLEDSDVESNEDNGGFVRQFEVNIGFI